MSLLARTLETSPYLEVFIRRMYWRSPWLVRYAKRTGLGRARTSSAANRESLSKIEMFLEEHGVSSGRLMVVHSSAEALRNCGYLPNEIVERLIRIVGADGTLAMPAFPRYREAPEGAEYMTADVSKLELVYDVKKTMPWTGVLPLKLMQMPGAVRSRHPVNSMVAIGPQAKAMMARNLQGDKPLPHGPQSSWKFCVDHGAIIVALGVDMAHSLTMIHVAEESYEDEWPVREWYRDRKFKVVDGEFSEKVVVRERDPRWALYFAERTLSRELKRAGLLISTSIDGILVEVIESKGLLEFLNERKARAYPYFAIPRRKMRR